jgi:prepilin-type N-terminal cleavage/methylation domain-containing protein
MSPTPGQRGFTLVELLVVMTVIGIIAGIGVTRYRGARNKATATAIVAEMSAVRTAAFQVASDGHGWPPDSPPGVVPPALAAELGGAFSFTRAGYQYDWEVIGSPLGDWAGLTVRTVEPELIAIIDRHLGDGTPHSSTTNAYTWIFDDAGQHQKTADQHSKRQTALGADSAAGGAASCDPVGGVTPAGCKKDEP